MPSLVEDAGSRARGRGSADCTVLAERGQAGAALRQALLSAEPCAPSPRANERAAHARSATPRMRADSARAPILSIVVPMSVVRSTVH